MNTKTAKKPKTTTIGRYLLDQLQNYGVQHIFGVPGDYVIKFDKLIENHPIQFINSTRENTAGYMADAYARIRGLGVACITYGVGINIANAVAQAYIENSPLVIISGTAGLDEFAKTHLLHHMFHSHSDHLRDATQMDIFRKITVAQALLDNPHTAQEQIDRVLKQCVQHQKPVYIEIPRDRVGSELFKKTASFQEPVIEKDQNALEEVLQEAAHFLKNSNRPVIWVGHEIQRRRLSADVVNFAEKYRIPIVSSLLGKTAISEYHPLYIGIYHGKVSIEEVREYVESADTAFVFGVDINEIETGLQTANFNPKQKLVATDEEIQVNYHQYLNIPMDSLIQSLVDLDLNIRYRTGYPACIDRQIPTDKPHKQKKLTVKKVFNFLQKFLKNEHVVISDFGDALFGSMDLILEQDNFLSNPYFAALGFGVPAAIGAAIAMPEKRMVGIVGDGAFQMTCTELSTAIRYHLDPIIILLNNHGYATERPILDGKFNDVVNWKYSKIPLVLGGGEGACVKTEAELDHALDRAFEQRGTFYLIEIELDQNDCSEGLKRFSGVVHS